MKEKDQVQILALQCPFLTDNTGEAVGIFRMKEREREQPVLPAVGVQPLPSL